MQTPTILHSYGLYWFGLNEANQKFVPGEQNPYLDPARPTMIFVHGWQPFISNSLPTFNFNGVDALHDPPACATILPTMHNLAFSCLHHHHHLITGSLTGQDRFNQQ